MADEAAETAVETDALEVEPGVLLGEAADTAPEEVTDVVPDDPWEYLLGVTVADVSVPELSTEAVVESETE